MKQQGYDALGRLTRVTDALNQITQYGYDELGNQITQTDALGRITKFEYDKLGRRTKRTLPLNQVETYTYNSAGNLISRKDFNAKTTTYSYDSMNRLLSKTPDVSFSAPAITFTYSSTGRRLAMNDAHGVTSYSYDTRDRLLSKATPEGTLSYTYDNASNQLTLRSSNANGASVDYGYDSLNRLSTVTGNASGARAATGTTTYRYDDVGNLGGYLYPNGVDTSYTYNTLNRLMSMTLSKASTSLASFSYELGAAGNRTAVTELSGRHVDYTYDALYRLKSEAITSDAMVANNGAISYTYDAVGNRLNRTSTVAAIPTTTSAFNGNDQLGSDAYDSNGNTTTSAGKTYVYDFENRIKSLNSGQIVFVYDGDGNRVAKTIGGVTTKFLIDTSSPTGYAQVVEEIVGSSVQRVYEHGHSLISQVQLISGNWVTSFYGYDGHGSVRVLTDLSGAVTDTYTYDAFGNLIASAGTTSNNYLYAGEQFDPDLGFYYLRARYMNASSGRFLTMDTFEGVAHDPLSIHKYLYASANAVNNVDPSGKENLVSLTGGLQVRSTIQNISNARSVAVLDTVVAEVGTEALTAVGGGAAASSGLSLARVIATAALIVGALAQTDDSNKPGEIFFRVMSSVEYVGLAITGGLTILKTENFVSQSLEYVLQLALRNPGLYETLVVFKMQVGTRTALESAGAVSDSAVQLDPSLAHLPHISMFPQRWPNVVHIKGELGAITYGLRPGTVSIF